MAKSKIKAEIRFRAEVVSPAEWERLVLARFKYNSIPFNIGRHEFASEYMLCVYFFYYLHNF